MAGYWYFDMTQDERDALDDEMDRWELDQIREEEEWIEERAAMEWERKHRDSCDW
jgi:hypothetical protein